MRHEDLRRRPRSAVRPWSGHNGDTMALQPAPRPPTWPSTCSGAVRGTKHSSSRRRSNPSWSSGALEVLGFVRASSALLRLLRGRLDEAELLAEAAEAFCRPLKRFETRSVSLLALAIVRDAKGDSAGTLTPLRECVELEGGGRALPEYTLPLSWACRVAVKAGDERLALRLTDGLGPRPLDRCVRASLAATLASAHGDPTAIDQYADSARRWGSSVCPTNADGRCSAGREPSPRARAGGVQDDLRAAHAVFSALGATPALTAVEELRHARRHLERRVDRALCSPTAP